MYSMCTYVHTYMCKVEMYSVCTNTHATGNNAHLCVWCSSDIELNPSHLECRLVPTRPSSVVLFRDGITYNCFAKKKVQKCTSVQGPTALMCASESTKVTIPFRCDPLRGTMGGRTFRMKIKEQNDISCSLI